MNTDLVGKRKNNYRKHIAVRTKKQKKTSIILRLVFIRLDDKFMHVENYVKIKFCLQKEALLLVTVLANNERLTNNAPRLSPRNVFVVIIDGDCYNKPTNQWISWSTNQS